MSDFSPMEMWDKMGWLAKAIAYALVAMSLYSWFVTVERFVTFSSGAKASLVFMDNLRGHMERGSLDDAIIAAKAATKSPIAKVMQAGLSEYVKGLEARRSRGPNDVGDFDLVDAVNRSLERVKERETANLRRGLGALASIASVAPFVGLLGTVIGIINAFSMLKGGGGLDVIGPGISEALVETAFGLFVAIPAAMVFNYFTGRVEYFVVDMNDVSSEFVDYVLKEGRQSAPASTTAASG